MSDYRTDQRVDALLDHIAKLMRERDVALARVAHLTIVNNLLRTPEARR